MCFFRHKWGQWEAPVQTEPTPDGKLKGKRYIMQGRICDRCGKWERKARW